MAAVLLTLAPAIRHVAFAALALGLWAELVKATKYGSFGLAVSLTRAEAAALGAVALALGLAGAAEVPWLGVPLAALGTLAALGLWLDAVLFRVFTIELGPGGVRDVVASVLWRELAELGHARRFFAREPLVLALVPAAALAMLDAALGLEGPLHVTGVALAGAPLVVGALVMPGVARGTRRLRAGLCAAAFAAECVASGFDAALVPVAGVLLALAMLHLAVPRAASAVARPAGLGHFFAARRLRDDPRFEPRPEHRAILAAQPELPRASARHGALRGADVLLFSFESAANAHLALDTPGGAATPFFAALCARGVRSRRHLCVCPTTNDAHAAFYTSSYPGGAPTSAVAALRDAGYRTAYLTAARTRDYGLATLLERAGFETIIDGDRLGPNASDYDLCTRGLELLRAPEEPRRPLFLHVHATHTHLPYRVVDSERFARFDAADDRGRLQNGIEESDHVFERLHAALLASGLAREPLLVVTSDHGQAFGALGYQSHGSAVVADELLVPLGLAHPALAPGEVAESSHFDILPTVLDLVGVPAPGACFGASLFAAARAAEPGLLVWAGHPSRSTTTNAGLVSRHEKLMVDVVLDRAHRMDPEDRAVEELHGADKRYAMDLMGRLMALRGVP